jgi:hypothetical protein
MSCCTGWNMELDQKTKKKNGHAIPKCRKHPTAPPLAIPEAHIALNARMQVFLPGGPTVDRVDIEVEELTGQVGQVGHGWDGSRTIIGSSFNFDPSGTLDRTADQLLPNQSSSSQTKCGSGLHISDRFHSFSQLLSWTTQNSPMTIHREPNERDPLLQAENGHTDDRGTGPMEISRSTRHGILAGIWVATFLTVSLNLPSFLISHPGVTISSLHLLLGYQRYVSF